MKLRMPANRERLIDDVKQRLILPRLLATLILSVTALSAVLTSFLLLSAGVLKMWVRYPIAIVIAYLTFLLLLAVWLWLRRRDAHLDIDLIDAIPTDWDSAHSHASDYAAVGDYGGGGSGGDWTSGASSSKSMMSSIDVPDAGGLLDLDAEGGCLVALAILAIIGGVIASFYVIWIAPALLAEILVDGVLVAGLYRRVKGIEHRHWLRAAVRRTAVPALVALLFFTTAGYLLQRAIPDAHSIGEVWHHIVN
jgi:hypothetical protein